MIVEITGLSSAGKTHLLRAISEHPESPPPSGLRIIPASMVTPLSSIDEPVTQSARVLGVLGSLLGFLMGGLEARHATRVVWAAHRSSVLPHRSIDRWNGTFNAVRQWGRLRLVRRTSRDCPLTLLDTGTVHTVYNFFIDPRHAPPEHEIDAYLDELDLPDEIVWVMEERATIVERTATRSNRRTSALSTTAEIEAFHDHAFAVYEQVAAHPRIRPILTVHTRKPGESIDESAGRLLRGWLVDSPDKTDLRAPRVDAGDVKSEP